ncbi:helix-turn-helix transcriptional regulator [Haloarculaceae archaeon H-GB2-1]|nr:helix-turn-helix transcriptional regulator [Haloarculaceae archaeon H-GB1-1]MEA5387099.1 helix-turn-helix transcriptional regulator [Haloarculaceae archaeon H-GB11]MEA5408644.1 helix-turn-helix transcriptional regulator [Haloarculaceae archaeon H-GB2-1]
MDPSEDDLDVALPDISPRAWRLLRVAAGFEQREVEKQVGDLVQAHISMLENDTRSLSQSRLRRLFELYTEELTAEQVAALVDNF